MIPWLTVVALLPALGALVLIFVKGPGAKLVALVFSLLTVVVAAFVGLSYSPGGGMQFVEDVSGSAHWAPTMRWVSTASG